MNNLQKLVADSGIQLVFSDYALEFLADQGFDIQFGARPLKRLIQKEIVNQLSKRILAGDIDKTKPVLVDVFDSMSSLGRKFLMAGKSGLNLTHSEPFEKFVSRYGNRKNEVEKWLSDFTPDDLREVRAVLFAGAS